MFGLFGFVFAIVEERRKVFDTCETASFDIRFADGKSKADLRVSLVTLTHV